MVFKLPALFAALAIWHTQYEQPEGFPIVDSIAPCFEHLPDGQPQLSCAKAEIRGYEDAVRAWRQAEPQWRDKCLSSVSSISILYYSTLASCLGDKQAAWTFKQLFGTPAPAPAEPPPAIQSAAKTEFEQIMLPELKCDQPPNAGLVINMLAKRGYIQRRPQEVIDSINIFYLERPQSILGLTVVAVFGFDQAGEYQFVRAPGTAPGRRLGVISKSGLFIIDDWLARTKLPLHIGNEVSDRIKRAIDLTCARDE